MARKHFEYTKRSGEEEMVIYYIEDEQTGKKKYFVLERLPNEYQGNEARLQYARKLVAKYNKEKNKKAEITSLVDKKGREHWFMQEPTSMVGAKAHAIKNDIVVNFKKTKNKAVAIGLAATILVGSTIGLAALANRDNDGINNNDFAVSGEVTQNDGYWNSEGSTSKPSTSQSQDSTTAPKEEGYADIDLDTFKYETYLNSAGVRMIKTEDAFKIAETCYNVMSQALEEYNKSVPEDKRYNYDPTDFDSSHMMARWTRESSLILNVDPQNNEDVKNANDYKDQCRGPFKMSADAINEANNIAVKIFGEKIIKNEEDMYNPIKQCMASYLFNIQANEYFKSYGVDDVKCSQFGASYLYGTWGTVRDKRENSSYAKDIEYYADCYDEYKDAILSEQLSESEKEQIVKKLTLKLWEKPNWSEVESQGMEPGQ